MQLTDTQYLALLAKLGGRNTASYLSRVRLIVARSDRFGAAVPDVDRFALIQVEAHPGEVLQMQLATAADRGELLESPRSG